MSTIFAKIISGELPCHKIDENDDFLAFLDVFPLVKGHTLVIPKKGTDYIFDIESNEYMQLWLFAQNVAKQLKLKIACKRIGVAVIGLEVAHAHIHLIPINNVSDINFEKKKLSLSQDELASIASQIKA